MSLLCSPNATPGFLFLLNGLYAGREWPEWGGQKGVCRGAAAAAAGDSAEGCAAIVLVCCCGVSHAGFSTAEVQVLWSLAACLNLVLEVSQRRFAVGQRQCCEQNLRLPGGVAFTGHYKRARPETLVTMRALMSRFRWYTASSHACGAGAHGRAGSSCPAWGRRTQEEKEEKEEEPDSRSCRVLSSRSESH